MDVQMLLAILQNEQLKLIEEEEKCDRQFDECHKNHDLNSAAYWAYKSQKAFNKARDIQLAINVITERVS